MRPQHQGIEVREDVPCSALSLGNVSNWVAVCAQRSLTVFDNQVFLASLEL